MYPAKQWLPSNVHLGILDMLSDELPGDLRGTFDVVHVRAFACVIKGGDPTKVVKKMRDMLSMFFTYDLKGLGLDWARSGLGDLC